MPRILPAIVLAAIIVGPRAARAQGSAAEALFEQGRAALTAGDLDTACAKFRASDQIEPAAGTRANLADCEERRGRVATAWEVYKSALSKLPPDDSRVPIIRERIAKLEARLPTLVLRLAAGAPKDTTVREGDATIGAVATYGVPLPLDPGVHHLLVLAPGHASRAVDATLTEGKVTSLAVEAGLTSDARPSPGVEASMPAVRDEAGAPDARSQSPGPWIVGGIGLAGLIVGAVTGGIVVSKKATANANCTNGPPPTCSNQTGLDAASAVRTLGPVTTVALVAGATAVAGGAIWLGVRRTSDGRKTAWLGITPVGGGALGRLETSW